MSKVEATYTPALLDEYKGNPLVEALPPVVSDKEVLSRLYRRPAHNEAERALSKELREKCILRIPSLVCPTPMYLELHRTIEDSLLLGYGSKHPFSPTTAHWLHYVEDPGVYPSSGPFVSKARVSTIFGASGTGKTTMIKTVLEQYPQIIRHTSYDGKSLPIEQVVYVYVECPESASITSFCQSVLSAIDDVCGSTYRHDNRRSRIPDLQRAVQHAVRNAFIGLLVVDEIENIEVKKSGGKDSFLAFLLRLVNTAGVPFLVSGTPEIVSLLGETRRISRRFEAGGTFHVESLDPVLWPLFVKRLWTYQWTSAGTQLTDELSQLLLELSEGAYDFAVRTFCRSQKMALYTEEERITEEILKRAAAKERRLTDANFTEPLRPQQPPASGMAPQQAADSDATYNGSPESDEATPTEHLVTTYQHPEFQDGVRQAGSRKPIIPDSVPLDIFRSARKASDPIKELEETGVLAMDLLELPTGHEIGR